MCNDLTRGPVEANIISLSQKTKVGISPRITKATTGHFLQWFFCAHQKHKRHYALCFLLWRAVLGNPLKGWPVPWPVVKT